MASVILTKVSVNSSEITPVVFSYSIERSYGFVITQAEIRVSKTTAATLDTGQTVEIWRGFTTSTDLKVFSGYIESFQPDGGIIKIVAKDKLWDLVRKEVTHVYDSTIDASAGKISDIFKDLVTTYGLLNADSGTIQDSGTINTIAKFVCNHADIYDRCKALAQTLDWQFYYRADTDKVYLEPKGYVSNSTILTVGSNVIELPQWNYDNTEMTNDVTIVGAYQEVETTESGQIGVTSGYTTTYVQLGFEPKSTKIYTDASNPPITLRMGGVEGSTTSFYYSVDKNLKQLKPKSGTNFTGNWYFQSQYTYKSPVPVHCYDSGSIGLYGQFKTTLTYDDIRTVSDAIIRGKKVLSKYSSPFVYADLKVKLDSTYSFDIGQSVAIVDNISNPTVNETMVVNKITLNYPGNYDTVTVGDKEWRMADWQANVETQLKRLQEQNITNQDIITELVDVNTGISYPFRVNPRYLKVQTLTASGTNLFILGNASYGILGTDCFGATGLGSATTVSLQQYNNDYIETFYDATFKDAATTATWSGNLSFTAGQVGLSTSIDYNNGTITVATGTITNTSGTFLFEMTADGGSHWETCTSGVSHSFANTGTDLRFRITESGASTGVITKVEISAYH